jgi:hypothetical protein
MKSRQVQGRKKNDSGQHELYNQDFHHGATT